MKSDELEELLRLHDWYYEYTDDFRVWQAGRDWKNKIELAIIQVPDNIAHALWRKHAPTEFEFRRYYRSIPNRTARTAKGS